MQLQQTEWAPPPELESSGPPAALEIVIPYTEWALTQAAIERAATFGARLTAQIRLIAVHTAPYPMEFGCPAAVHANLVEKLIGLAALSRLAVRPQVVLARGRRQGFQSAMSAESTVLVASRRRPWKTSEERLAAEFAADGHKVAVFYVE